MYTINDLKKLLGLSTANQVRNRIEAIKDLLTGELRRGPNNQILVTAEGLALLRRLQDLYDGGLTITQASEVLRTNSANIDTTKLQLSSSLPRNQANQDASQELIAALREEIAFLRARLTFLEEHLHGHTLETPRSSWWEELKEETDGP